MKNLLALSTTKLIGLRVCNRKDEDLGKVEDLMLDPEYNRVAYAVLSFDATMGFGSELFAVPMDALTLASDGNSFVLNVDKRMLERAPSFSRSHPPDTVDRRWSASTYAHYGYEPYWEPDGLGATAGVYTTEAERAESATSKSGRLAASAGVLLLLLAGFVYMVYTRGWPSTRDRIATTAHAAITSVEETSKDAATTARVKTALALSKSVSAFDINVDTRQGVVKLRGQVPSEEMKLVAERVAQGVEGVLSVENILTVTGAHSTSSSRSGAGTSPR